MKLAELVPLIITFICGGGLVSLFTLRQTKRSKDLENVGKLIDLQNNVLDRYKTELSDKIARIDELEKSVIDLQGKFMDLQCEMNMLRSAYDKSRLFRCENINCKKRVPKLTEEQLKKLQKIV